MAVTAGFDTPGAVKIVPVIRMNDYDRTVWMAIRRVDAVTGQDYNLWNFLENRWTDAAPPHTFEWGAEDNKPYCIELSPEVAKLISEAFQDFSLQQNWVKPPEHAALLETEVKLLRQEIEFLRNLSWEIARGNRTQAGTIIDEERNPQDQNEQQGAETGQAHAGGGKPFGYSRPAGTFIPDPPRYDCLSRIPRHEVQPLVESSRFEAALHWNSEGTDAERSDHRWRIALRLRRPRWIEETFDENERLGKKVK